MVIRPSRLALTGDSSDQIIFLIGFSLISVSLLYYRSRK
ncbi:LPXTG cell wall anchor domain-containing protein [Listeria grandensis]